MLSLLREGTSTEDAPIAWPSDYFQLEQRHSSLCATDDSGQVRPVGEGWRGLFVYSVCHAHQEYAGPHVDDLVTPENKWLAVVVQSRVRPESHPQVHDFEAHFLDVEAYPHLVAPVPVFLLN